MQTPSPLRWSWSELVVGSEASFETSITHEDMEAFARLSGDYNPLHVEQGVPYGMFAGLFFSRLLGMYVPGLHCLYLSQTVQFKRPLPLRTPLRVSGKVLAKSEATRTLTLLTTVMSDDTLLVQGEAFVQVTQ